jgi:hypothetical protein
MLFMGALFGGEEVYGASLKKLKKTFGPVLMESPPGRWKSRYYRDELGPVITRRFVFFENLITQDSIRDIKLGAIALEDEFREGGRRLINLDPGYLTLAKVVLASKKDYSHRIYLGEGIFAETTLYYQGGKFNPHLFTYPDFKEAGNLKMFKDMRKVFREKVGS